MSLKGTVVVTSRKACPKVEVKVYSHRGRVVKTHMVSPEELPALLPGLGVPWAMELVRVEKGD